MIDFACKEFSIQDIVKCSLSLTKAECTIFSFLLNTKEELDAKEVAACTKLDLTTVQRALKNFMQQVCCSACR